jgi:alpha-galactosidase
MTKVVFMGAGSMVFAMEIMKDIVVTPGLDEGTFALVDIDSRRLDLAHQGAEFLINKTGRKWTVEASTDRTKVIAGADYLINTIEVAGMPNVSNDYDIPLKYGIDQCIGDTIGPGGLFKALRTLPAWIDILHDLERLAPGCQVLNYTNPMSLTVLTGRRACNLPIVGLCHSVQGTSHQLAGYLDMDYEELDWKVAGINHLAWFTRLEHNGQDMYPVLRQRIQEFPAIYERDPVRFELMRHLGLFPTESSGHNSEYVPYFRKRPDLLEKYIRSGYRGESGFYAHNWPTWRQRTEETIPAITSGQKEFPLVRGHEYASYIIESIEFNRPQMIYGNVLNTGLIDNLPQDGVVEVSCLVDRNGVQPTHHGRLPSQLAALDAAHMYFHDLVATSALECNREAALHALMIDPLTAAVCSPEEIEAMFNEMVAAEKDYLPDYLFR